MGSNSGEEMTERKDLIIWKSNVTLGVEEPRLVTSYVRRWVLALVVE